jgi:multisubunit Na+/H+ antiporter MnhE subunit
VLLFANNWSSDRIIYGFVSSIAKNLPILKFCTRGTADYYLNIMKATALFPILFIQNNLFKKKSGTDIFYQIIAQCAF